MDHSYANGRDWCVYEIGDSRMQISNPGLRTESEGGALGWRAERESPYCTRPNPYRSAARSVRESGARETSGSMRIQNEDLADGVYP